MATRYAAHKAQADKFVALFSGKLEQIVADTEADRAEFKADRLADDAAIFNKADVEALLDAYASHIVEAFGEEFEKLATKAADLCAQLFDSADISLVDDVRDAKEESQKKAIPSRVAISPEDVAVVESYDYDVLAVEEDSLRNAVLYIFFDSPLGRSTGRMGIDEDTFMRFHEEVKSMYFENPFHNYSHACDVTHSVYRSMMLTEASKWLGDVDQYALLVAAFCHDIGHPGKANPFLIETKHELAMRYNDKSPLENMHAACLFDICTNEALNVFKGLDNDMYKQARKVCVLAILHTDNANHFEMVKDVNSFYEATSEVCDLQARSPTELHPQYESDVLQKDKMLWMELFLHLADVGVNSLKPFDICKAWAWRILDEFFNQGDEEKRLGIPVGMLNDRENVNKPGSQHGYINFLVAPLTLGAVNIFPTLIPLGVHMAKNIGSWRDVWIKESSPLVEDIAKRDADVKKISNAVEVLQQKQLSDGGRQGS